MFLKERTIQSAFFISFEIILSTFIRGLAKEYYQVQIKKEIIRSIGTPFCNFGKDFKHHR
jgi:hypothetical protein